VYITLFCTTGKVPEDEHFDWYPFSQTFSGMEFVVIAVPLHVAVWKMVTEAEAEPAQENKAEPTTAPLCP
jgi:hypothetical protein